jgi:hypothetical protein
MVFALAGMAACGDPPLAQAPPADTATEPGVHFDLSPDGAEQHPAPPADAGSTKADDGWLTDGIVQPDSGSEPFDFGGEDQASRVDGLDDALADALQADAAANFAVVSHSPKTGAEGVAPMLAIVIGFNQLLKPESFTKNTVLVLAPGDKALAGSWSATGNTATFTAASPAPLASRIRVIVTGLVQSQKGVGLSEPYAFAFYTAGLPDMAPYALLAARYAPTLRQGLGATAAADKLRYLDYDGNWSGDDNGKNLGQGEVKARVAWAVSETKSHRFLHYTYYWPRRPFVDPQPAYDNDAAGAIVVLKRHPQDHPVALLTFWKWKAGEEQWAWVTQESGLLPPGKKPDSLYLRGALPESQLFPAATDGFGCEGAGGTCQPRRYPGYLTAGTHQSCLWLDPGKAGLLQVPQCVVDAGVKAKLQALDYVPKVQADVAPDKGGNPAPQVGYALEPLHDRWWPHRDEAGPGTLFEAAGFTYQPPAGRPGSGLPAIASQFRNTLEGGDFGRPPWAAGWQSDSYYKMPRGALLFDPAWALWVRLGGGTDKNLTWDVSAKTGISLDYCLNPWLGIDERQKPGTDPACAPGLP